MNEAKSARRGAGGRIKNIPVKPLSPKTLSTIKGGFASAEHGVTTYTARPRKAGRDQME